MEIYRTNPHDHRHIIAALTANAGRIDRASSVLAATDGLLPTPPSPPGGGGRGGSGRNGNGGPTSPNEDGGDHVYGGRAIALYLFGLDSNRARRRVFNLWAHYSKRKKQAGLFKLNGALCLSKSKWRKFHGLE